jgi:hypothetical protein
MSVDAAILDKRILVISGLLVSYLVRRSVSAGRPGSEPLPAATQARPGAGNTDPPAIGIQPQQ